MMGDITTFEDMPSKNLCYEIRLRGHLDTRWADWFDGLIIAQDANGDTLLSGPVIDQAALHGLLKKVRDLGMPLVSVNLVDQNEPISNPLKRRKMKAIVYTQYGPADVLHLQEVEKPTPKDNEVLIKVHATSVTAGDCNVRGFTFVPPGFGFLARLMFGLRKPRQPVLGQELSGEVVDVGKDVRLFKKGDQVFGISQKFGAYAEYICMAENASLVRKPANITYTEAASIPFGANTALYFLRDMAKLQPGQKILIIGASGCTGVYAVQLAKYYGAEVTGVCSTRNLEMVRVLGADHVIDYTQEDFTQNGQTYDVILDMVPGKSSFGRDQSSLNPNGLYLAGAGGIESFAQMAWTGLTGGKKVLAGTAPDRADGLLFLKNLLEAGKLKPVIDRCYPLEQAAEAHRYADTGRKRGSVVITVP